LAADIQVSASLDKTRVALNEQAVLSVTVSGAGSSLPNPKLPELPGFQVFNAGRSQNFSWINGQASASVTSNFVLTPLQEGSFTIPPVLVEHNGQTLQTPEMKLDVVKGDPAAIPGGTARPEQPRSSSQQNTSAIFITGSVDKSSVYVGEPLVYTFRLYNRVNLLRQPSYQPPETSGFWTEDLPPQRNFQAQVKGVPYQVTEVRTALFPTTPGKARIGAAQLRVMLENVGGDPFSTDFFASFFGRAEEKVLRTEPLSVSVKALPEPKPAGFKGAVGQFSISASMDKPETSVGQAVTLTVAVSGRGNIKSLPDITLPALTNFRTLADNAAVNVEKQDGQVKGSKVFKTVLIPTASGELTIPPISYVYFDSDARAYKTLSTRAFTLKVFPGRPGQAGTVSDAAPGTVPSRAAPGIQRLSEDIHYIRAVSDMASQGKPLYQRAWFRWFHGVVFLMVGGLGLFRLYQFLFLSNRKLSRFKTARTQAAALLEKAESADALAQTLRSFIADKLGLENRELSLRQAQEGLRAAGVSAHTAEKLRTLWETIDLYRFAPAQARPDDIRQARGALLALIDAMEKEIAWKG